MDVRWCVGHLRLSRGALGAALILVVLASLVGPRPARAEDAFEIQVYDSDIDKPLETSIEGHVNYVARGRRTPDYRGELTPDQLVHMTLEPAVGITDFWELGGYLQFAWDPRGDHGGEAYFGGWKLRSKFVVPREVSDLLDLGINIELSHIPHRFEESEWGAEIRPILGFRYSGFQVNVNPILSFALSDQRCGVPEFEPCAKASWTTPINVAVGLEYYTGLGRIDHIPAWSEQHHTIFVALDLINLPLELNVGVGRGLTPSSNEWTVKAIVGRSF